MVELTPEEVADLREPVRRLCADRFDRSRVRETAEPIALDRAAWSELAEIGVFCALSESGLGLGITPVAALFEECGHGLAPGPLVWTALAGHVSDEAGDGRSVVAGLVRDASSPVVPHLPDADQLLVIGDKVTLLAAADLDMTTLAAVDPLTSVAQVVLPPAGSGVVVGAGEVAERWRQIGACLSAAYLVGLSRLSLEIDVEYTTQRKQFGRAIGGFQAVKHLLADVVVAVEIAAAAVAAAAEALDAADPGAARACASAKLLAGDAGHLAAKHCIQVHGGMGYSWETDPHLIWKRVMVYDQAFGGTDTQAAAIAARLG